MCFGPKYQLTQHQVHLPDARSAGCLPVLLAGTYRVYGLRSVYLAHGQISCEVPVNCHTVFFTSSPSTGHAGIGTKWIPFDSPAVPQVDRRFYPSPIRWSAGSSLYSPRCMRYSGTPIALPLTGTPAVDTSGASISSAFFQPAQSWLNRARYRGRAEIGYRHMAFVADTWRDWGLVSSVIVLATLASSRSINIGLSRKLLFQ